MTRRHFIAIAAELRRQLPDLAVWGGYPSAPDWERGTYDEWATVTLGIAGTLSDLAGFDLNGNRRFNRDRFLTACGFVS